GANMQFWPMGNFFRSCGAFFLRRSFQGDDLYRAVFNKYVQTLIDEGVPIEFFIEGGRSRTGKMAMPKYGLLSTVVQAFHDGKNDDLALVPVYLGYDRIVEESSYMKELGGEEKTKEKALDILKSSNILRKRFGNVYVNIGEPIKLKEYFASLPVKYEELALDERQALYRKISYEIVGAITKVSVVTPFSFISLALLSHDYRGISHDDLWECMELFRDYLSNKNVMLSRTFDEEERMIKNTLQKFEQMNFISKISVDEEIDDGDEIVYSLDDKKRFTIEYYKNNILHFFLPISFFALSVIHHNDDKVFLRDVSTDYTFLKQFFRHEFIFDDNVSDEKEIAEVLSYLEANGSISRFGNEDASGVIVTGLGRKKMERFGALTKNYIESYWVVIRAVAYLKNKPLSEKDFLKRAMSLGNMLHKKGEIRRAEALSQANFLNAMRYLREQGLLIAEDKKEKGDKKITRYYQLTDDKTALETMRRKVFRFI
ncbi:MAG: 1-acyl-sn-glycerol-3-phosphate acyltransferase, partial [Deltaproteobacteria bacterium]